MKITRNPDFSNGTSFFGDTVETSCNKLLELFGHYNESDPDKVNYEWDLLADNIPFTIYDWKEPYLDESMITNYHIGARNKEESKLIKDLVNVYLKNK